MPRPRKDNVPISVRLERSVYTALNDFCKESGQTKTTAIERAIMMYISNYTRAMESVKKMEGIE